MLNLNTDKDILSLVISNAIGEAIHLNIPQGTTTYSELVSANPNLDLPSWSEIENTFEELKTKEQLEPIRAARNVLIAECDWTQVSDAPLTSQQKQAWATYRQELRDITNNYSNAKDVIWPTKPE